MIHILKSSIILITSYVIVCSTNTFAQSDLSSLENAFMQSYSSEKVGDYGKSIKILKDNYQEESYELNLRLGWLHYSAGMYAEAINYYNKSILLMPMSIEARLGYVLPSSALGNWNQVVKQYEDILKIDDKHSTANYRLGYIYYVRKDYTSSFAYFQKVVNLYPFDYDGTHMFAWTNFQLGKMREAKILFQKTLLIKPGDASAKEGLTLIK